MFNYSGSLKTDVKPLYFQELAKYTPNDHPDAAYVTQAVAQTSVILDDINNSKKTSDSQEKLKAIEASIAGLEELPVEVPLFFALSSFFLLSFFLLPSFMFLLPSSCLPSFLFTFSSSFFSLLFLLPSFFLLG